jgi:protein-L-isoaspartate(D-aspartate) O-methyltransferase
MKDKRERMVEKIRHTYGLHSSKVLSVMLTIPREKFVIKMYRDISYDDSPVPVGFGQTMSQPYTVAFMTHLLISSSTSLSLRGRKKEKEKRREIKKWRVLEIGTGSGYQAAVLSCLVKEVYTVEIVKDLAVEAKKKLKKLGYKNVFVKMGSGEFGWKEKAPFDAILVTAGIEGDVPEILFKQLREGGVLVAPIGRGYDKVMMKYIKKSKSKFKKSVHGIFHFVPFVEEKS